MPLLAHLKENRGIMPSGDATRLGVGRYTIQREVEAGRVIRPRIGWIALPDCDPDLLFAAQHGVVISCISAASRLNLWVLEENHRHVASRHPGAKHSAPASIVHWGKPILPRPSALLEDPIENVLSYVAACRPWEEALVIWDSAFRKSLVDRASLERLPLAGAARELLRASTPFADSGLESLARDRLRWLRKYGIRVVPQAHVLGRRVDFLIGARLVLEIDGGQHSGDARAEDNRFDADLHSRGYTVIRTTYAQVINDWPGVQLSLIDAIGQGRHLAR